MLYSSLLRQKRFWAAVAGVVLLLILGSWWAVRSHRRAEVRDILNAHVPLHSPPLKLTFPHFVVPDVASRELLNPGVRLGLWTLRSHIGSPAFLEVRLSDKGRRLFSLVGNQIVATFKVGTRQVTRLDSLEGSFPTHRVLFRYTWKDLNPNISLLGPAAPEIGKEYKGEVMLLYENERWNILHWTTPRLEEAVARFRTLQPARDRRYAAKPLRN